MPNDPVQLLLRLAVAALCGALLGLNRGRRQKPAGLRTHALVAIGAAFAAWTAFQLEHRDPAAITRIMSGAMTGVGFLGAGVILHNEARGRIEGLTTAATIWMAAILGLGAGAGLYVDSLMTLAMVMLVLQVSARLQNRMADMLAPRLPGRRGPAAPEPAPVAGVAPADRAGAAAAAPGKPPAPPMAPAAADQDRPPPAPSPPPAPGAAARPAPRPAGKPARREPSLGGRGERPPP